MRILVVGDRLSKEEAKDNLGPWGGRYAQWMRKLLRSKGQIIIRNIQNTPATPQDSPQLRGAVPQMIDQEKPDLIFLCGPEVASLAGCFPWVWSPEQRRGQFDEVEGFRFFLKGVPAYPIPHPRDVHSQPHYLTHVVNTLEKATSNSKALEAFGLTDGTLAQYNEHLQEILASDFLVFDIETPMVRRKSAEPLGAMYLRGLGWATRTVCGAITPDQFGTDYFREFQRALLTQIANPAVRKCNQNIFFDLEYLDYLEIKEGRRLTLRGPVHCTKQAEALLYPDLPLNLGAIAQRNFILDAWKGQHHATGSDLRKYNMQDCFITRAIAEKQLLEMDRIGCKVFFEERRVNLYEHTFKMARDGMKVDMEKRAAYRGPVNEALQIPLAGLLAACEGIELPQPKNPKRRPEADVFTNEMFEGTQADKQALKKKDLYVATKGDQKKYGHTPKGIYKKAYVKVETINPNSPSQLKAAMAALNFPKVIVRQASTKKRVADSTGTDALNKILATKDLTENQRLFLLNLIEHRSLGKAIRSYYDNALDEDGVFRYYYDQDGAKATGRSSSKMTVRGTGGNSQNFPTRSKNPVLAKYKFKSLVVPHESGNVICQHDQSSAEAMIVAHLAGAKVLLEEFVKEKPDTHRVVAKFIHEHITQLSFDDLPVAEQKRLRNGRKAVSHGFNYAMAAPTLQETIFKNTGEFTPIREIEEVFLALQHLLPEIKQVWHARTLQRIQSGERWFNVFGRPIQWKGLITSNSLGETLAKEPQGTIPELTNEMLSFASQLFQAHPYFKGRVLQMCHDSVAVEVHKNHADLYNALFALRASQISLDLGHGPFVVKWDGAYGPTLGEQNQEFKPCPIPPALQAFVLGHSWQYTRRTRDV